MLRWLILSFILPVALLFVPHSARAEFRLPKLPILPSSRPLRTPGQLGFLSPLPAAVKSKGSGLAATISRALESRRLPPPPKDGGPRNAAPRDPARDRDATSLGVRGVPLSASGLGMAGVGLAAGAAKTLGKIGKGIDISVGPTIVLGGGGISLRGKW